MLNAEIEATEVAEPVKVEVVKLRTGIKAGPKPCGATFKNGRNSKTRCISR